MQNSVSLGLFTGNESIVADAFSRSMSVMTVSYGISYWLYYLCRLQESNNPMDADNDSSSTKRGLMASIAMERSSSTKVYCTTVTTAKIW